MVLQLLNLENIKEMIPTQIVVGSYLSWAGRNVCNQRRCV